MKIVRCPKCGKYIHKAVKCFHCGNTAGFEEISGSDVHENITQEYARMDILIEDKKYDEAIALSYTILEWMPNLAGVFWFRLLARYKCSTAIDLICKGFPCDEDSDFCNALDFSVDEEHSAYEDIKETVSQIRVSLKKEISEHDYSSKSATDIMRIKKTMQGEIERRKEKLFSLWSDLEDAEHSLYALEMDCRLLMKEHQTGLEKAAQAASAIKSEAYRMEECTAEKLHSLQVRMEYVLQQSESSKDSIDSMRKQHPWVKSFSDLVTKRNEKVRLINSEISSLSSYERTVQQTISEIERIESRHKTALIAADKYDFMNAVALLGTSAFNDVLRGAGVGVSSSVSIVPGEKFSSTEVDETQSGDADDEMDMEDYYAAWGLSED